MDVGETIGFLRDSCSSIVPHPQLMRTSARLAKLRLIAALRLLLFSKE